MAPWELPACAPTAHSRCPCLDCGWVHPPQCFSPTQYIKVLEVMNALLRANFPWFWTHVGWATHILGNATTQTTPSSMSTSPCGTLGIPAMYSLCMRATNPSCGWVYPPHLFSHIRPGRISYIEDGPVRADVYSAQINSYLTKLILERTGPECRWEGWGGEGTGGKQGGIAP